MNAHHCISGIGKYNTARLGPERARATTVGVHHVREQAAPLEARERNQAAI